MAFRRYNSGDMALPACRPARDSNAQVYCNVDQAHPNSYSYGAAPFFDGYIEKIGHAMMAVVG